MTKTMPAETLKALKASISTWKKRANGEEIPLGTKNCALCKLFHTDYTDGPSKTCCKKCPVYEHTGKQFCKNTPYEHYADASWYEKFDVDGGGTFETCVAEMEVDFLTHLLPRVSKKKST